MLDESEREVSDGRLNQLSGFLSEKLFSSADGLCLLSTNELSKDVCIPSEKDIPLLERPLRLGELGDVLEAKEEPGSDSSVLGGGATIVGSFAISSFDISELLDCSE